MKRDDSPDLTSDLFLACPRGHASWPNYNNNESTLLPLDSLGYSTAPTEILYEPELPNEARKSRRKGRPLSRTAAFHHKEEKSVTKKLASDWNSALIHDITVRGPAVSTFHALFSNRALAVLLVEEHYIRLLLPAIVAQDAIEWLRFR